MGVGKISGEKRRIDVDDEVVVKGQQNVGQENDIERFALSERGEQVVHGNIITKKEKTNTEMFVFVKKHLHQKNF